MARRSFGFGTLQTGGPQSGVVIVVSKKVAKTAVLRNKIRRRVRHALPLGQKGLTVFPTAAVAKVSFVELKRLLGEALASR
ncbi:MAG: ribonuclease P protein component [Patescibacteria group bacterium]